MNSNLSSSCAAHIILEDEYRHEGGLITTPSGVVEMDVVFEGVDPVRSLVSGLARFFEAIPSFSSGGCLLVGKRHVDAAFLQLLHQLGENAFEAQCPFSVQVLATASDGSVAYDCFSSSELLDQIATLGELSNITHMKCTLKSKSIQLLVVSHISPPCIAFLQACQSRLIVVQSCTESIDFIETIEDVRRVVGTFAEASPPVPIPAMSSVGDASRELLLMCEGLAQGTPHLDRLRQLVALIQHPTPDTGPSEREKKLLQRIKQMRQEQLQLVGEFHSKERQWQEGVQETTRRSSVDTTSNR